jgi:hypothetical protein
MATFGSVIQGGPEMKHSTSHFINFVFFQALWFAGILGAARGLVWPGLLLLACFMLWQLWPGRRAPGDIELILICAAAGILLDTLWIRCGLIRYHAAVPFSDWAPVWIVALWITLALTLNHSLAWLRRYPWAALLLGAGGSPLSYYAGSRLGAAELPEDPTISMLAFGFSWAVLVPALVWLSKKMSLAKPAGDVDLEIRNPGQK